MSPTRTILLMAWTLICSGVIVVGTPLLALRCPAAQSMRDRPLVALAWSCAMAAVMVPLTASVRGFNWVTALLIAGAMPAALWIRCHREASGAAFNVAIKRAVLLMTRPEEWRNDRQAARGLAAVCAVSVLVLSIAAIAFGGGDLRVPTPVDIDTLWHARALMSGTVVWDPLAALVALLSRVSTAEALLTLLVLRVGMIAACVVVSFRLLQVRGASSEATAVLPAAVVVATPALPTVLWLALLMVGIAVSCWQRLSRDGDRRQAWNASAALAVAVLAAAPFIVRPWSLADAVGVRTSSEAASAPGQVLRVAREFRAARAIVVAPPLQQIEVQGTVSYRDLQAFVTRYEHKAGDPRFRFESAGRPLLVFVEMRPLPVLAPSSAYAFLSAQPPVYGASRERWRLAERAKALCEAYRRTHRGASVIYDDDQLRIYRIDA